MFIKEHYYEDGNLYIKCSKCGEFKLKRDFPKDKTKYNGIRSSCKKCNKEYYKKYAKRYDKNNIIEKNIKRKARLQSIKNSGGENPRNLHERARLYIDKNNLRPKECMVCGLEGRIEFHHPSYDNIEKRKEGVFVCISCHRLIHSGEIKCPEVLDLTQLNAHMPTLLDNKAFEFLLDEPDLYEDFSEDATDG